MSESVCRWCGRAIVLDPADGWIDPEATGDDRIWREVCDSHDTRVADHEPEEVAARDLGAGEPEREWPHLPDWCACDLQVFNHPAPNVCEGARRWADEEI
jgi:hypothetical protein